MRRVILALVALVIGWMPMMAEKTVADTLSIEDMFLRLPIRENDLVSRTSRLDMLDFYRVDSLYDARNSLMGKSHLVRPLTEDYLKCQVTNSSTITMKRLPYKDSHILVVVTTVGDDETAGDSEIAFFDAGMRRQKSSNFFKAPQLEDFFDFSSVDKARKSELLGLIPFSAIEYTLSPDSEVLEATLALEKLVSVDAYEKLEAYFKGKLRYGWTGKTLRKP